MTDEVALKKPGVYIICCVAIAVASSVRAQNELVTQQRQVEFDRVIAENKTIGRTTQERIERLSKVLLGAPYVDGNLGEGAKGRYDQDPLSRFDVFDCTTYVETVLAGAMSQSVDDFLPNLKKIRYQDGYVSFSSRNHFPSADWLPNNRWMLSDVTQKIGASQTRFAKTLIDKKSWYQHMRITRLQGLELPSEAKKNRLLELQQLGTQYAPEWVTTPYIPLTAVFQKSPVSEQKHAQQVSAMHHLENDPKLSKKAKQTALRELAIKQHLENSTINTALLKRIPNGSVISMVRPNYQVKQWIGTNMNITHQAIAIHKKGRLYIRNASLLKKEVVDQDFVTYFSRYLENSSLKGFNVQLPTF
ncbi:N-acetylmuramoyl-L-alanine amidase-like domain-containing protein [Marinomonas pollencensis]|uniref:Uncharacterized protein DUF1460 n=1 Tax=Marinomonas pollencensis TaxID=491954 RepID=A0A3E0DR60_9GAMM|nr:N-acetylmuramoyl-L-alanine amidase-like domain-containing protein [Marinomonas pollencensis]REG84361.1 uncharacterized protein DUF1460 [Marinomonas pollencensis]